MGWKNYFYKSIIENSKKIDDKNIKITANDKYIINAQIQGSEIYNLTLKKDLSEISCDCPFAMKKEYCKHMAALLNFCEQNNSDNNINFSKDKFDLKLKIKFKQFDSDEEIKYIISKTGCTKEQVEDYIDAEEEYLDTVERVYDDKTIEYICNKTGIDENLVNKISEAEETYLIMTGLLVTEKSQYNYYNKQYNDTNRKDDDFISKLNFSYYCSSSENLNKINDYALENNDIDKNIKTLRGPNKDKYKNNIAQILYILIKSKDSLQIKYIDDELKKNKEFALQAIRANSYTLQYFDESIKDDEKIVIEAVKCNGLVLEYASNRLKDNYDIAFEAVKSNRLALNM